MAADSPIFGIKRFAGQFIDELKTKDKVEVATRKNRVGKTALVYPHNQTTDVSISGGGEPPLAVGIAATHGVTGLAGGCFVVTEAEHTDKNSDFDEFSISATHYPDATAGTVSTT